MDVRTQYLGLQLQNPLVLSASPLSYDLDTVRRAEEAGASALVMYSLFEEQINHEVAEVDHFLNIHNESYAEAISYFPEPGAFHNLYAEEYLEHIQRLKAAVQMPIIASLNGVSVGGWMNYAKKMEAAGADAIELNVYYVATDPQMSSADVEEVYIQDLRCVKSSVQIPVAIKLSPYFSSFANLATRLDQAGADGLVLFNRFYQPDIDLENLEVVPNLKLSSSFELRLPLRWIAILYGKIRASLAATSGVHTARDVLKLVMAGADVTMMASVLIKDGVEKISSILTDLKSWMEEHEYASLAQMKGSMSYRNVSEPAAFERANYIKTLQSIH